MSEQACPQCNSTLAADFFSLTGGESSQTKSCALCLCPIETPQSTAPQQVSGPSQSSSDPLAGSGSALNPIPEAQGSAALPSSDPPASSTLTSDDAIFREYTTVLSSSSAASSSAASDLMHQDSTALSSSDPPAESVPTSNTTPQEPTTQPSPEVSSRECTHCRRKRPPSEFVSEHVKGLTRQCKKCRDSHNKRRREARSQILSAVKGLEGSNDQKRGEKDKSKDILSE
ncbi:hypothetical protein N7452_005121 [Penicillium brevicompactum]|uniref:Uncharacterized protein n=1 Tax=Penicillium brevicompactum TaxID=5074 RepID=A0A9W9QNU4_PENBR|nr:hypothetical protein N7452_005121 [Penicillium brevicompactum]